MAKFQVAHIREQGADLIIIPLTSHFDLKSKAEQLETVDARQRCASDAGLAGTVVPVWKTASGGWSFLAPSNWTPFFKSLDIKAVAANLNRELTCDGY
jgi:hypothetical protein